jgi:tetratricopeptide (TPR) repeat protein
LGAVYEEKNNLSKAMMYVRKAVDVEPINAEFWYILGDLQAKMKLDEKALESYHKVSDLDPSEPDIWLDLSEMYFNAHNFTKALQLIKKGIGIQAKNASLIYRLAAYLYLTGQAKESQQQFEKALDMDTSKSNEFFEFAPELAANQTFIDIAEIYKNKP